MIGPSPDLAFFWIGFRVILAGGNPYDLTQLHEAALRLALPVEVAPIYYSPLLFLLLAPILSLPLMWASVAMIGLNLSLLFFLVHLSICFTGVRISTPEGLILAMMFPPFLMVVLWGQSSLIVAVSLMLAVCLHRQGLSAAAGVAALPAFLKPHVVSLVIVYLCTRKSGLNWVFTGTALVTLLAAFAVSGFLFPGVNAAYLSSVENPLVWLGHSPMTALRLLFHAHESKLAAYSMLLVAPALVAFGRIRGWIEGERDIVLLLCLSALITPYIWIMDFVALYPALLVIYGAGRRWKIGVCLGSLIVFVGLTRLGINWQSCVISIVLTAGLIRVSCLRGARVGIVR